KMAERGQIRDAILDGPLAFDNAISIKAARIKRIDSSVAGDPDIMLVPDLEAGNMLVKTLTFLSRADGAAVVLGARVPIILTSRADNKRTRMASCAVAALYANARAARAGLGEGWAMAGRSVVVNRGSSSLKLSVYVAQGAFDLVLTLKGQVDGIGTRPRLRARDADGRSLVDQTFPATEIPDVAVATGRVGAWLRERMP